MPTADHAKHDDQAKEQEGMDEADYREVRPELGLFAGRDKKHYDAGDEEHQQEGAY
jgi:hypothetical protein